MGRKEDIKEVERIARKHGMTEEQRRDFGDFLEECKREGDGGTKNERGDFTWDELDRKAREFLGEPPEE
jgi:hypothetical protein